MNPVKSCQRPKPWRCTILLRSLTFLAVMTSLSTMNGLTIRIFRQSDSAKVRQLYVWGVGLGRE